jgi:hypothetical protein
MIAVNQVAAHAKRVNAVISDRTCLQRAAEECEHDGAAVFI